MLYLLIYRRLLRGEFVIDYTLFGNGDTCKQAVHWLNWYNARHGHNGSHAHWMLVSNRIR